MKLKTAMTAAALAAAMTVSAGAIDLYVDAAQLHPDVPPTAISGRTLVPLRSIFEAIGATVEWDNATQTATGRRGDSVVEIQLGSPTAYINGAACALDVPAQAINGRTMVPVRFVSEALDCTVEWDGAAQAVYIFTADKPQAEPTAPTTVVNQTIVGEEPAETNEARTIYVTPTGKRYHYDPNCNGGTYIKSTLAEAQRRGLTPCKKCVE